MTAPQSDDHMISEASQNDGGLAWPLIIKDFGTVQGSFVWSSAWTGNGFPAAGAAPAATPGTQYDNTDGSSWFAHDPQASKHLTWWMAHPSQRGSVVLYDRLVAVSGLSLASTGNKTVASAALLRSVKGLDVEAWLEITTQTATTGAVVSANCYTNQAGTTGRAGTTVTLPAVTVVGSMFHLPLQAGDNGVRAVSTINVATAASAGACNLVLLRRLGQIQITTNCKPSFESFRSRPNMAKTLPKLEDGATLALMGMFSANAATTCAAGVWWVKT